MVLAALAACIAVSLPAVPALAVHVQCGDVLTADTRLDSDLDCPNPDDVTAITIAASDVTLDLGGYTVSGPGLYNEAAGIGSAGVEDLVIRNGTVRGFSIDLLIQETSGTTVRGVTHEATLITGSANTVRDNAGGAIAVRGDRNLVSGNVVERSWSFDDLTWLSASGTDNVIVRNLITGVGSSSADATAYGLLLRMNGGLVAHNGVTAAAQYLVGADVTVTGIHLSGDSAVVRKNVASGHIDGFEVLGPFQLTDNLASSNLDDGIDVNVSGSTLTRNEANDNGDLGIEATSATIDGGGNRAAGNGNAAQCVGVVCR